MLPIVAGGGDRFCIEVPRGAPHEERHATAGAHATFAPGE